MNRLVERDGNLYTVSQDDEPVYGEKFRQIESRNCREWDPERSKAAAAIKNGLELDLPRDTNLLYLGAASGTTVSHFSDLLTDGLVYAVEISKDPGRDLLELARRRKNIIPIIQNARKPEKYSDLVGEVDAVFQDISQRDQVEILKKNCEKYLKPGGKAFLALKTASISSTKSFDEIKRDAEKELKRNFLVKKSLVLDPSHPEHVFFELEYQSRSS